MAGRIYLSLDHETIARIARELFDEIGPEARELILRETLLLITASARATDPNGSPAVGITLNAIILSASTYYVHEYLERDPAHVAWKKALIRAFKEGILAAGVIGALKETKH